jgi:hypothetical protein
MGIFSQNSSVNIAGPVNRAHHLARDLAYWWICLPGLMGGEYLPNLMAMSIPMTTASTHAQRQTTGADTYTNAPTWGSGTNRLGGFGHLVNPALTSPSGMMKCGDVLETAAGATWDFTLIGNINIISHKDVSDGIMGQMAPSGNTLVVFIVTTTHLIRMSMGAHAFSGTSALLTETWYQVATTWTAGAGTPVAAIYLNGRLQATGSSLTASDRVIGTPTSPYILAGNPNLSFARPLNARFDDFRVYKRALTASEILDVYQNSILGYPGLLNRTGPMLYVADPTVFVPQQSLLLSGGFVGTQYV